MHHAYGILVLVRFHFPMVETIGYNIKSCPKALQISHWMFARIEKQER
jgi:hypothetical protein